MSFTHLVATFGYWAVLVFVAIQCAGIPFPGAAVLVWDGCVSCSAPW
ncbi:MAG TPA: hypothetical protein VED37_09575 [Ktedonobacteraceae bacterium]|nr:hypothetical protein [Ktedonobacteraceae bacterium]